MIRLAARVDADALAVGLSREYDSVKTAPNRPPT